MDEFSYSQLFVPTDIVEMNDRFKFIEWEHMDELAAGSAWDRICQTYQEFEQDFGLNG